MHADWKKIAWGVVCIVVIIVLYVLFAGPRQGPKEDSVLDPYSTNTNTTIDSKQLQSYDSGSNSNSVDPNVLKNYSAPQ